MPPTTHLVETLFDRPIAFHRIFAKFTGSINAGLMLSQAVFWSRRTKDEQGWFYKSQAEWEDEICLTRREQDTARLALRRLRKNRKGQPLPPFWFEERRGIPARLFYRVDMDALMVHLEDYHLSDAQKRQTESDVQLDLTGIPVMRNAQKRQTRLAENAKLDTTKAPIRLGGKRQSGLAENAKHSLQRLHAKTTSKSSSSTRARAQQPAAAAASQFSEAQIREFLDHTKPHNASRNGGLARKLWLTGEDDHLISHWKKLHAPATAPQRPIEELPDLDELRHQATAAGLSIPGLT